jgi:hypothetical protein
MTRYHTPVGAALAPPMPRACPEQRRRAPPWRLAPMLFKSTSAG